MNDQLIAVEEIVNAKIKSMIDAGELARIIEERVEKTINDVVDSEIRTYSDFGKSLAEYVNKSLQVDFKKLGFEGYHETLLRVISKVYENSMQSTHLDKVKKITEEMLANPPELVTLSSLIEAVKEKAKEKTKDEIEAEYEGFIHEGEITCIIEGANDKFFTYICLDPKENQSVHSCEYRIGISKTSGESEIFSLRMNGKDDCQLFIHETYGLEKLLFKAKCASSKFEFDVENPDLSYEVEIEPSCHC